MISCACHSQRYFAADAVIARDSRVDPTNTGKIRRRWENDLVRRFRRVRAMIRETLVKLDVLGLRGKSVERAVFSSLFERAYAPQLRDAGEKEGHPFRGNQWTTGTGSRVGEDPNDPDTWPEKTFSGLVDLYHVTVAENLAGIKEKGFISGEAGFLPEGESFPGRVFFFTDPKGAAALASQIEENGGIPATIRLRGVATKINRLDPREDIGIPSGAGIVLREDKSLSEGLFLSVKTSRKDLVPKKWKERAVDAAPAPKAFAFETSANKVNAFMEWLYEQERAEILEVSQGTPQSTAAASAWQNVYVDSAYQSGLRSAQKALKFEPSSISGAINQPIHADRIGIIYTRAYRDLEGITDAMDQAISRALANGMAQGKGVLEITADLEKAVDSIGILRARTLARTETIAAHAEASLNLYEEAGVYEVEADVEFTTAGDDAVCPQCQGLSGERYSVEDARGVIPVHPNCRCAWLPVIP